jgi:hypothetical protein
MLRPAVFHDPRQQALNGLGHPFDILVFATERFDESQGVIGSLSYPGNKYGKVIHEVP